MTTEDKIRAEFEKWATNYFENIFGKSPFLRDCNDVDADRTYHKYEIEDAYNTWLACQQLNDKTINGLMQNIKSQKQTHDALMNKIAAKDAEIAKLREALQVITDLPSCELNMYNYHYDDIRNLNNQYVEIYNIVTQALEKNDEQVIIKEIEGVPHTVIWRFNEVLPVEYWHDTDLLLVGFDTLDRSGIAVAIALPPLPRNPTKDDAKLLYAYAAQGLVVAGTVIIPMKEFIASNIDEITHAINDAGERVEIAIIDRENGE